MIEIWVKIFRIGSEKEEMWENAKEMDTKVTWIILLVCLELAGQIYVTWVSLSRAKRAFRYTDRTCQSGNTALSYNNNKNRSLCFLFYLSDQCEEIKNLKIHSKHVSLSRTRTKTVKTRSNTRAPRRSATFPALESCGQFSDKWQKYSNEFRPHPSVYSPETYTFFTCCFRVTVFFA